eukprot:scaffold366867_cov39-Prasinocladus_malaysianus.AAC.1
MKSLFSKRRGVAGAEAAFGSGPRQHDSGTPRPPSEDLAEPSGRPGHLSSSCLAMLEELKEFGGRRLTEGLPHAELEA